MTNGIAIVALHNRFTTNCNGLVCILHFCFTAHTYRIVRSVSGVINLDIFTDSNAVSAIAAGIGSHRNIIGTFCFGILTHCNRRNTIGLCLIITNCDTVLSIRCRIKTHCNTVGCSIAGSYRCANCQRVCCCCTGIILIGWLCTVNGNMMLTICRNSCI